MATPDQELVCITGASGYVGSHITKVLIERGYRVRALVRDTTDAAKVDHLKKMGDLELAQADLTREGSFDEPAKGCDLVVHAASAARFTAKDPQRDIVDVAVLGTRNVIRGVLSSGTVRSVVQTSSIAAIGSDDKPPDHVFTETDWNTTATLERSPYYLSKTLAEREAASLCDGSFSLTAINPGIIYGPVIARVHLRSSPALVRAMMQRKMPGSPRICMPLVDVRDVAEAHALALEHPDPSPRYVCVAETLWTVDVARILASHFPHLRVPTRQMPDLLTYLGALLDKRLSFSMLRHSLGRFHRFSSQRIKDELGLSFRPVTETIRDTASSILENNWL